MTWHLYWPCNMTLAHGNVPELISMNYSINWKASFSLILTIHTEIIM